jgi:hypothetical protein
VTALDYSVARVVDWHSRVRLLPILLSVLAFPFVAIGWTAAAVVVALESAIAAVQTGYSDLRDRHPRAD